MKLFEVFGVVKIDSDTADKKLDTTDKKGSKLGTTFSKAGKAMAIGVGVAGAAIVGLATKAAATTDRIDKMSQSMGLSRQSFQEWEFIASQSGTSIETLQTGMKTLTMRASELKEGLGTGSDAFEKLGLSMEDIQDKSQEEIFEMTVQALQAMPDDADRAALSIDLLGKAGLEMTPLLNSGTDAIDNMKAQANDLGLVLGDDAVDAGVAFTDTMDQFKRMMSSVVTTIGASVMPIMTQMAGWIMDNMPTIQSVFKVAFGVIGEVIDKVVEVIQTYFIPIIQEIYDWVQENMDTIKEIFKIVFDTISENVMFLWGIFKDNLLPILVTIFEWISTHLPEIKKAFETVFGAVKIAINIVVEVIKVIVAILKELYGYVENTFSSIGTLFKNSFDGVSSFIQGIIDTVTGFIDKVKEAIALFSEWANLDGDKVINERTVNNRTHTSTNDKAVSGKAIGGNVTKGATYRVNEIGQEFFTPGQNGTIIPANSNKSSGVVINLNLNDSIVTDDIADTIGDMLVNALMNKGVVI